MTTSSDKPALAIIGAGVFQTALIRKASEMGFETHVFSWAQDSTVGGVWADHFYPISITEKQQILEQCQQIRPVGVVSIGSDLAVITVNYLAEALGLTCNPKHSIAVGTNKYLMREALAEQGCASVRFIVVDAACVSEAGAECDLDLSGLNFPLIVKPTDRSGSRGITKVLARQDLNSAILRAQAQSFEQCAIVEEYVAGEEFSIESISFAGHHTMLAVTRKFTTGSPNFIETGHLQPSGLSPAVLAECERVVIGALDALGMQYGASHAELKIDQAGTIKIIEVGLRMGGDFIGSDLVQLTTGYDYLRMVIEVACKVQPTFAKTSAGGFAFVKFSFSQADNALLEASAKRFSEYLEFMEIAETNSARTVTDSSTRYGYALFFSATAEPMRDILGMLGTDDG
jgi:biotin carboxylase